LEKFDFIPYGRQDITEEDINEVIKVLRSNFLTQGSVVPAFEQKLCNYIGVKYSVVVNSCTSALHIACLALDLGPGDILWTSPITFVASANCALYCGATVDFVDIDIDTALMSVEKLKRKLEWAEKEGKLPKIVIPVHFAGQSCDMREIHALSQRYDFKIIEDAAHAIGAEYQNDLVGGCQYSDITVFSFHPVKIITTGEGGAAMTNSLLYAEKMKLLRSHGIIRDKSKMTGNPDGPWYYEQIDLGFNYRMTDIQAALGNSQLNRLDWYVSRRKEFSEWYDEKFHNTGITPLTQKKDRKSAHHLYVLKVIDSNQDNKKLYNYLYQKGIGVNLHYIPIYKQPFFQKKMVNLNIKELSTENADKYYSQALTLPLHPRMTLEMLEYIVNKIYIFFD
jgi:UDP-4-amino-4,6-dideoxy-N-acetyl-beta-L-altrosamine transaminase